jgi:hypothetical protein
MSHSTPYSCFKENLLDLFAHPARIIIAGVTNSGKTHLATKIVVHYQKQFDCIIVCGSESHPLEKETSLSDKLIVNKDIIDPINHKTKPNDRILYILDDCFIEAANNDIVSNIFTKGRHENISVVLLVQNVFMKGKHSRNISLNTSHFILLKQRDLGQLECLGRQLYGKSEAKRFLELYKKVVLSKSRGYLLIDLGCETPDKLQFRSNILCEYFPHQLVYQW